MPSLPKAVSWISVEDIFIRKISSMIRRIKFPRFNLAPKIEYSPTYKV